MKLISLQAIGMNPSMGPLSGLPQRLQNQPITFIVQQEWLPPVSAIHYMVNRPFNYYTQLSRHGRNSLKSTEHINSHP